MPAINFKINVKSTTICFKIVFRKFVVRNLKKVLFFVINHHLWMEYPSSFEIRYARFGSLIWIENIVTSIQKISLDRSVRKNTS